MRPQDYKVNIIGLSQKAHEFDFKVDDAFFEHYGQTILPGGHFDVMVTLNKRETMIEAKFQIHGEANLICDRSLDPFAYPMDIKKDIVFKYGTEAQELSDEIVIITREQESLDLGQFIYELIAVNVPMKKLHPRFMQNGLEDAESEMVYTSGAADNEQEDEDKTDPRWEKLKKLK